MLSLGLVMKGQFHLSSSSVDVTLFYPPVMTWDRRLVWEAVFNSADSLEILFKHAYVGLLFVLENCAGRQR